MVDQPDVLFQSRFFAKALPDGDLRYVSKLYACFSAETRYRSKRSKAHISTYVAPHPHYACGDEIASPL